MQIEPEVCGHAVILAAGKGSRLGRTAENVPKPLLQINSESLITRLIRQLSEAGTTDIHIVVGFAHERIVNEVETSLGSNNISLHWVLNSQFATSNNIVSLGLGLRSVLSIDPTSSVLVVECDVVIDDDWLSKIVRHNGKSLAVVSPFEPGMDGTVVTLRDGCIQNFIGVDSQDTDFDYRDTYKTVNIYRFDSTFWNPRLVSLLEWYSAEISQTSYYEHVLAIMNAIDRESLEAIIIPPHLWTEIDDLNDYRKAKLRWSVDTSRAELAPAHGGYWDFSFVDFSYLRNMYFPPRSLIAQLRHALESAIHNYGSSQVVLDQKMSWWLDVDEKNVVALPGLSAAYPILAEFLAAKTVLIPTPTFGEYVSRFGDAATYPPNLSIEDLQNKIRSTSCSVVVIVNPNNPTGNLYPSSSIQHLVRYNPDTLFLIDESFLDFTDESSVWSETLDCDNFVILCSLSKSMGVPGIRIGYLISRNQKFLERFRSNLPIWSLSSIAERFLEFSLKFRREYEDSLRQTKIDKRIFTQLVDQSPRLRAVPFVHGNFILIDYVEFPREVSLNIVEEFLKYGYLVKDVTQKTESLSPVFRVAVRLPDENQSFVRTAQRISDLTIDELLKR